jgi:hypothetical protein
MPAKDGYLHIRIDRKSKVALARRAKELKRTVSSLVIFILQSFLEKRAVKCQAELDQIDAELQWQKEPAVRARLNERRRILEADIGAYKFGGLDHQAEEETEEDEPFRYTSSPSRPAILNDHGSAKKRPPKKKPPSTFE